MKNETEILRNYFDEGQNNEQTFDEYHNSNDHSELRMAIARDFIDYINEMQMAQIIVPEQVFEQFANSK